MPSIHTINISGLQSSEKISDVVIYANSITNNMLGGMFLIVIASIMLMVLVNRGNDFSKSMLVTCYSISILSILFRYIGFVSNYFVFGAITLTGIMIAIVYLSKNQ